MNICTFVTILSRNPQYDFPKMRGGSKAFWNFSENSSVLETPSFPKQLHCCELRGGLWGVLCQLWRGQKRWLTWIWCATAWMYSEVLRVSDLPFELLFCMSVQFEPLQNWVYFVWTSGDTHKTHSGVNICTKLTQGWIFAWQVLNCLSAHLGLSTFVTILFYNCPWETEPTRPVFQHTLQLVLFWKDILKPQLFMSQNPTPLNFLPECAHLTQWCFLCDGAGMY